MGKGDLRTRRGKLKRRTHGKTHVKSNTVKRRRAANKKAKK